MSNVEVKISTIQLRKNSTTMLRNMVNGDYSPLNVIHKGVSQSLRKDIGDFRHQIRNVFSKIYNEEMCFLDKQDKIGKLFVMSLINKTDEINTKYFLSHNLFSRGILSNNVVAKNQDEFLNNVKSMMKKQIENAENIANNIKGRLRAPYVDNIPEETRISEVTSDVINNPFDYLCNQMQINLTISDYGNDVIQNEMRIIEDNAHIYKDNYDVLDFIKSNNLQPQIIDILETNKNYCPSIVLVEFFINGKCLHKFIIENNAYRVIEPHLMGLRQCFKKPSSLNKNCFTKPFGFLFAQLYTFSQMGNIQIKQGVAHNNKFSCDFVQSRYLPDIEAVAEMCAKGLITFPKRYDSCIRQGKLTFSTYISFNLDKIQKDVTEFSTVATSYDNPIKQQLFEIAKQQPEATFLFTVDMPNFESQKENLVKDVVVQMQVF